MRPGQWDVPAPSIVLVCEKCGVDFTRILRGHYTYVLCHPCNRQRTGELDRLRNKKKNINAIPSSRRKELLPLRSCVRCKKPFATNRDLELCCACTDNWW